MERDPRKLQPSEGPAFHTSEPFGQGVNSLHWRSRMRFPNPFFILPANPRTLGISLGKRQSPLCADDNTRSRSTQRLCPQLCGPVARPNDEPAVELCTSFSGRSGEEAENVGLAQAFPSRPSFCSPLRPPFGRL